MLTGTAEKIVMFLMKQDREKVWDLKQHRKKRTLSQNAYYWQLLTQTAEVLKMKKPELHNRLIRDYGQRMYINGALVTTSLPDTEAVERQVLEAEAYHLNPTSQVLTDRHGRPVRTYVFMRGSSDYDTKEMSVLVDGLVQEAQALGIETLTPRELEAMREREEQHHNK